MHLAACTLPLLIFSVFTAITAAQTTSSCNPTKKTCPSNPALTSQTYTHDFTTGLDSSTWNITAGNVTSTSSGALFTIKKSGDAPTIRSAWYIFFGRVSFIMRTSPGTGIVSSAILLSDDLDELDWEFLGGEADVAQTNYFGKGQTGTTDREGSIDVEDSQTKSHNYTIVWGRNSTEWLVDDVVRRTLTAAEAVAGGNSYPQTPMDVRIGIWAGGDSSNAEGTIEWAGGETDFSKGPFEMVLEKVEVVNENPGTSYKYGDMSGDADSIEVSKEESDKESSTGLTSAASSSSTQAGTTSGGAVASTGSATATAAVSGSVQAASEETAITKAQSDGIQTRTYGTWFTAALSILPVFLL